jgi:hypothetical protein
MPPSAERHTVTSPVGRDLETPLTLVTVIAIDGAVP